jgi:hypothetical protein
MSKLVFRSMNVGMIFLLIVGLFSFSLAQKSEGIKTPQEFFGFEPGADGMLFNYDDLVNYLMLLDQASPKLKMIEIGQSPLGKTMYVAFISSAANLVNLDRLKDINRQLALDYTIQESERESLIKEGKVFVAGTLTMHSTEVGPSQAAPLVAYDLVTTEDAQKQQWLNDAVYMMVPCHNPDGMDMVVNHYNKYKGTKYDGSSMPGIYHKYVGHNNNRDFVTLSQEDTRAISRLFSQDWFPQILVEKHQMGSTGPRYFVPPMHDPIAENIDATLWSWTWVLGSNMVKDMTEQGLSGVSQHYLFDDYWPGSTETCIWKNVIGLLTEAASVKYATPVYIEPNELSTIGKGLGEYKKSINMSMPWPGGWWRLSDIVEYEIASTLSLLKTSSMLRDEILRFRNDLCRKEVKKGQSEPPYYYVLPVEQHDPGEWVLLINLLQEHGINVYRLNKTMMLDAKKLYEGDVVVPLAQPFRAFIKEVLEKQKFPVRRYTPNGEIIKPYDITSWSLPLHMGVQAHEMLTRSTDLEQALQKIEVPFKLAQPEINDFSMLIFSSNINESYKAAFQMLEKGLQPHRLLEEAEVGGKKIPAGSFILSGSGVSVKAVQSVLSEMEIVPLVLQQSPALKTEPLRKPRIALVETYFHDMDAGWTRFVFDTYSIPFQVLRPGDFEKTDLSKQFDVVIFPDVNKSLLMEGKYKGSEEDSYYVTAYPPEYTKGLGKKGMENLMTFLDKGGRIISWGRSTDLFTGPLEIARSKDDKEQFQLPVRNLAESVKKAGFYAPGSLIKIVLNEGHPLTYGMPEEVGVFFRGLGVYQTSPPNFDMDRRVIATFPEDDIVMSGYADNAEKIANKSAVVWLKKGTGQFVLMGFNPQFRGSTHATYKLLFNALFLPPIRG